MRVLFSLFILAAPVAAQTPEVEAALKAKLATLKFLGSLYDADSGGYRSEPGAKPSLRATNAAVKATKYLGGKPADPEKTAKFVLGCYDDKTGAFAEPGGRPDVATTCIGVMAAMELGIAKERIAKAKTFLEANAKAFEEVRITAAAVEAWGGPKDWDRKAWKKWCEAAEADGLAELRQKKDAKESARICASADVALLRLREVDISGGGGGAITTYKAGQRDDGGWGKAGEKASDMESVYRVMRAMRMLNAVPRDPAKLRAFIGKHRNDDGGCGTKPGEKSTAAGTYYAVIVTKWLDELEKK